MPGDEDDGKAYSRFRERALKIQTAHAGKSDIENQAAGAVGAPAREKLLRRRKRLRPQRHRRQKILDRSAHTRVVVNDEHNGCVFSDHLCASCSVGKVKWKVAPRPGFAQSWPPCDSMIVRLIASPIPVPPAFVVTK